ncbi:hypothetical protein Tco_1415878 [Tanacetum coccineum]
MAQPQRQADVHQDELCPPNKRYALMDPNKKMDHNPLTIFQLPQATYNNHEHFVVAPKFLEMVPFYINNLGFTLELRSPSKFKTTGLVQPWQTLNIHVDYADLLWEGLHYSLEHPSTLIPYPRFTKLIVSQYMTAFPEILRRDLNKYHNLDDDMMVKNIFNSGKHNDRVRMKIPSWMITDEMKLTENYRMYDAVFGVDVPTTQSQPIESTQGTHRTTSAPRLRIPQRRSTRLTPPTSIPTTAEADDIILQDTIQLSLAEQKSHDELEAKQNVQKVKEHLIAEEIEKLVEGTKNVDNVEVNSSTLRQDDTQIVFGTRLEPRNYKESPEVEITVAEQPVNAIDEEEESSEDDYELRRREKGSM